MDIQMIAGFAVITQDPDKSAELYQNALGLKMKAMDDYRCIDRFPGCNHFGVWPLKMAAQSCFGSDDWPETVPVPTSTMEFELGSKAAVYDAVEELKTQGYEMVHEVIEEPWGQTMARFLSPEQVLIGLSYAPWLHDDKEENSDG